MAHTTTPARKGHRRIRSPSWMRDFVGILSVTGKGSFSSIYHGVLCGMIWGRGQLQVFRTNSYWSVRLRSDNLLVRASERRISSEFRIQGYLPERSFYRNFVQHGKVQIIFGTCAFLHFDFDDFERDVEVLRKISKVFEYYYSKNDDYVVVEEVSFSGKEAPEVFSDLTLGENETKTGKSPGIFTGNSPEKSTQTGNIVENITRNSPGNITGNCPENSTGSRNSPGKFPENSNKTGNLFENITRNSPRNCPENPIGTRNSPGNFLGNFPENSTKTGNLFVNKTRRSPENSPQTSSGTGNLFEKKPGNSLENQLPTAKSVPTSPEFQRQETEIDVSITNSRLNHSHQFIPQSNDRSTPEFDQLLNRSTWERRDYTHSSRTEKVIEQRHEAWPSYSHLQSREKRRHEAVRSFTSSPSTKERASESKKFRFHENELDDKENIVGKRGFSNLHNTCYMISTLQALLSFPILIHHLTNNKYSQINNNTILSSFLQLNRIRFHPVSTIKTRHLSEFKHKMIKTSNKFDKIGRHEDAHEYYLSLKEALQREINHKFPHDKSIEDLTNFELLENPTCPTCPTCALSLTNGVNVQTHSELGIDIPKEMIVGAKFELNSLVESALEGWTGQISCPCGRFFGVSKRFFCFPEIFVIHLRRYWLSDGIVEKNSAEVNVPEILDLKRFSANNVSNECEYQLQAVVEHLGQLATSGHYIARVRHQGKWLKCDDEFVTTMQDKIADNCQESAYLLFYGHEENMSHFVNKN